MGKEHKEHIRKQLEKRMNQTRIMYLLVILVCSVAIALLIWFGVQAMSSSVERFEKEVGTEQTEQREETPRCEFGSRYLDGVCLEEGGDPNPRLVGIMVENHVDARPQAGLAKARVVYEAPVEANYSRFLTLYTEDQDVDKIGPVRSSRHYYLDWLREYGDVLYMHVGGSPLALHRIRTSNIFSINEMGKGWYFWRSTDRYAPHNTYTSTKLWDKAFEDYWQDDYKVVFPAWSFEDGDPCQDSCVEDIDVTFLAPNYRAVWRYNKEANVFERYQGGKKHKDQDGTPIVADTVIIQNVHTILLDEIGRLDMETVGEGKATIFRDGKAIEGLWRKQDKEDRTVWVDADGVEIPLKPGKIWIELVNERGSVDITYEHGDA